jgi:para-nitrobenzyl esterase
MDRCTVLTKNGVLRGRRTKNVFAWLGVPYAKPPVGSLRFKPAQPAGRWEGVRDATVYGPVSLQQRKRAAMSEDCLTLNIWSPCPDDQKRAVLFFMHGGAFCSGAGSDRDIRGANLTDFGDVVVVTINYRLGVLGFMDFSFLGEDFTPNCGLTDVIEALAWTHKNIEAFGGDPHNITVFGQSAGAILASVLPVIPTVKPYLSKVIMMSGDPTIPYTAEKNREIARKFLAFMDIRDPDALLFMPAEKIAARQMEFSRWCRLGAGTFMLEIDGKIIPEYPIPAVLKGAAEGTPILIGTTREEMSFLMIKPLRAVLDFSGLMEMMEDDETPKTRREIRAAYSRYGKRGAVLMLSDIVFRVGSAWYAEAYSMFADTWMYRFDYETVAMKFTNLHAFHSCDIPFVFGNYGAGMGPWMFLLSPHKKDIRRVSKEIRSDFLTFAKTGRLSWKACQGAHTPGKSYGGKPAVVHMIEPDIKEVYNRTDYRKRSFEGCGDTISD